MKVILLARDYRSLDSVWRIRSRCAAKPSRVRYSLEPSQLACPTSRYQDLS